MSDARDCRSQRRKRSHPGWRLQRHLASSSRRKNRLHRCRWARTVTGPAGSACSSHPHHELRRRRRQRLGRMPAVGRRMRRADRRRFGACSRPWRPVAGGVGDAGTRESGIRDQSVQSVALRGECFSLPLVLERSLAVSEKQGGWRLDLNYRVTNTGGYPVPWAWAAHPLFVVEAGDRIVLPPSIRSLRLEGSGGQRLGQGGATVAWPIAQLASGGQTDLSVAQPPDSGIGDKLFTGPLSESENWCALERPSARLRIKVSFDTSATPYLGLWICYGGWPDRPGPKQVCVALEPATAPVDSLAKTGAWSRTLDPGQSYPWTMHVDLEVM